MFVINFIFNQFFYCLIKHLKFFLKRKFHSNKFKYNYLKNKIIKIVYIKIKLKF